jgi:predicted helicase
LDFAQTLEEMKAMQLADLRELAVCSDEEAGCSKRNV